MEEGKPYPTGSCRRAAASEAVVEGEFGFSLKESNFSKRFSYSSQSNFSELATELIWIELGSFLAFQTMQPWHSTLLMDGASASASVCLAQIFSSS